MHQYEMDEDRSAIIAGKRYRTGFLRASLIDEIAGKSQRQSTRLLQREQALSLQNTAFHYTSLGGLKGIVEEGGLWATDARFLNDSQELAHGVEIIIRSLRHIIGRSNSAHIVSLLIEVENRIEERRADPVYVACFSLEEDDLNQWRGYGSNAGVCIKFNSQKKLGRPLFFAPSMLPWKVEYCDTNKYRKVISVLRRFVKQYLIDRSIMSDWPDDHDKNYVDYITSSLEFARSTFKDKAFSGESEVRIIISHDSVIRDFGGAVRFRVGANGLIPFLSTGQDRGLTGRLPIESVVVGPSEKIHLVETGVRAFLSQNGYSDVAVLRSRVPFRPS